MILLLFNKKTMRSSPIPNSQQLSLGFSWPINLQNQGIVSGVQKETKKVLLPVTEWSKLLKLNGVDYEVKIGKNTQKGKAITYNEDTWKIQKMVVDFKSKSSGYTYTFWIGIDQSDTGVIRTRYITRLDSKWVRYGTNGDDIFTFNYFLHIFWRDVHNKIIEELKRILLDLNKEKQ